MPGLRYRTMNLYKLSACDEDGAVQCIVETLEAFFAATNALRKKNVECLGWEGPKRAHVVMEEAQARFAKKSTS